MDDSNPKSRKAIITRLRAKYLTTERDRILRERIDELVERQGTEDEVEARGLVITGESGAGKSKALKRLFSMHPEFSGYGTLGCKLVTIIVPSPCTLMQLGRVGCGRIGYPIQGEKKQHRVWEIFREHLKLANVEYLHFDEIQNIMETANEKDALAIRNMLKSFLNDPENRICLILSGLPGIAKFLQLDRQESRRCAFVPFPSVEVSAARDIYNTAAAYAVDAGLEIEPHEEAALGVRLLHASCYQLGLTLEITIGAIDRALRVGDSKLTCKAYAAEFFARTGNHDAANPFLATNYLDIDCSKVLQEFPKPEAPPSPPPET